MVYTPMRKTNIFKTWIKDNRLESGGKLKLIAIFLCVETFDGIFFWGFGEGPFPFITTVRLGYFLGTKISCDRGGYTMIS